MMMISAFISVSMLLGVLMFFKSSYFEDREKSFEYPLFDSTEDLQDAINLQKKENEK
jgi:nitrogen fixation-related uncharacterized protein